jgi:hypothetical protein
MKYFALLLLTFALFSCKKDPEKTKESDVITSVEVKLYDSILHTTTSYFFKDADGPGGATPSIDTIVTNKNTAYGAELNLLNETQNPVFVVTNEIIADKEDHQFFYKSTPALMWQNIQYLDFDANTQPIGLHFSFNTQSTSTTGTFNLILRLLPNKSGLNVSSGDITNAGGESEVEIDFPVKVQ